MLRLDRGTAEYINRPLWEGTMTFVAGGLQFYKMPVFFIALLAATIIVLPPEAGAAADRYYRNSVDVRTGSPSKYVIEVPESAAMHGGYYKVTTDDGGRVTRVIFLHDGKPASETVYKYGDGKLPSEAQTSTNGAVTGLTKITRDSSGQPIRTDHFTAQGALTGYTLAKYFGDRSDSENFTADGHRRWRSQSYYDSSGIMVRSTTHTEGISADQEKTYDPLRGIEKSSKQFLNGKLQLSRVNTYDPNDDLVRQDLYDEKERWYGALTYENNHLVKRFYKFLDGHTQETTLKYDANGWRARGQQTRDGKLICSFVYEYLPDGTIKRTIALGADGSLWAEYPDLNVSVVGQDGHPPNSTAGTVHKKGKWW
jgi:antitoxin component YwqK of YwqJK toxin-antitoxin module